MAPVTTTKTATLASIGGGTVKGKMTFKQTLNDDGSGKVVITGTAEGFLSPTTVYVSLVYGVKSVPGGPTPCRDDRTLGGVILDPQDILGVTDLLKNVPIVGPLVTGVINPILIPALQAGLGPLNSVNNPPPGGMLFSPKATARMFLGVWKLANAAGKSTFGPVTRTWTGPNDALGIPFSKINTVSIRQPQIPLLPNAATDARPQIFQLRACGQLL